MQLKVAVVVVKSIEGFHGRVRVSGKMSPTSKVCGEDGQFTKRSNLQQHF